GSSSCGGETGWLPRAVSGGRPACVHARARRIIPCQLESMLMTAKIFGLGLSKTGTSSLQAALRTLGYRAAHFLEHRDEGRGEAWLAGDFETDCLASYDAALDLPVPVFYAQLDQRYPGSRFILTVREMASWLESVRKHWERYWEIDVPGDPH